ncbi:T9SS type A sorting domain-containing protein [Paracrocinitomix mangrovi]|uniref:M43 family zinc metalloprotease n=1 Tax=Paracrocinitomix mangrovi TaxID=2862509 RepID=UPI001C8D6F80|nr:M43 family zinc metalloprotease [Paracrocinitomix mangrovi]UKN01807.1 T9SS type A sorting domain-containing protein [Paracrocinitomix mangrovi]
MKKFSLLFVLAVLCIQAYSQEFCGSDFLLRQVRKDSVKFQQYLQEQHNVYAPSKPGGSTGQNKNYVQANTFKVPVVFHIIGAETSEAGQISHTEILNQLDILNQGFANALGSTIPVADDAQIEFCLAQNAPSGLSWGDLNNSTHVTEPGVTRYADPTSAMLSDNHNQEVNSQYGLNALTGTVYFNPQNYLNIWVVNYISEYENAGNELLGYATSPNVLPFLQSIPLDGIVMRSEAFGMNSSNVNYNQGRALIHEAGHYFGLYHTSEAESSCEEYTGNLDCHTHGDWCCDTPPTSTTNQDDCNNLIGTNSCPDLVGPQLEDMIENHMDYAFDNANTCRNTFTDDQASRMHQTIINYRSNLVSYSNLLTTGVQCTVAGLNPIINVAQPGSVTQICVNEPIGFSTFTASGYLWNFEGATPSTSTDLQPTNIVWDTPGVYNISLTVYDGNGGSATSAPMQIYVTDCNPIQSEYGNWYFGRKSAVSFGSGFAEDAYSPTMSSFEACASISDSQGNLLFYTDGISIFNSSHAVVNSNNLMNGSCVSSPTSSSAQGTVIVPKPQSSTNYFIYTNSDIPSFTNQTGYGVSQYEIDASLNYVGTNPTFPTENYATTEPLLAVPHCNGTDYWLIVKPVNDDRPGMTTSANNPNINQFIASYKITNSGIENVPVLSDAGPNFIPDATHVDETSGWTGKIAVSPDKKYIAFTESTSDNTSQTHLYYFNCETGHLEFISSLGDEAGVINGVSFSPNSRFLYVGQSSYIFQYDLENLSVCNNVPPHEKVLYMPPGTLEPPSTWNGVFNGYSLQLGPDEKVYVARRGFAIPQKRIGVINYPNEKLLSSNSNEIGYNPNAVYLDSWNGPGVQSCYFDLPNDIDGDLGANSPDFTFCSDNCGTVYFANLGCGTNFQWNFGDSYSISGTYGDIPAGTNDNLTSGNFEYPVHIYQNPGTYVVELIIDNGTPYTQTIVIDTPPTPTITGPNPVCTSSNLPNVYTGPSGNYSYSWSATNGDVIEPNEQETGVSWNSFPATLTLQITDNNTQCTSSQTITVTSTGGLPTIVVPTDAAFCEGTGPITLDVTPTNGNVNAWFPPTDISCLDCEDPEVNPAVTTTYTVFVTNGCGTITQDVLVTVNPNPTVDAGVDQLACDGASVTLNGSGADPNGTYVWDNGVTDGVPFVPTVTTTYTVIGTDENGCQGTDQVLVTVDALPDVDAGNDMSKCNKDAPIQLNGSIINGTIVGWSPATGLSDPGILNPMANPGSTTIYTLTAQNQCGTNSDFIEITVFPSPYVFPVVSPGNPVCTGELITLEGTGATTYVWDNGVTDGVPFNIYSTTTYTVIGTDDNGCTHENQITVEVENPLVVNAGNDALLCLNESSAYNLVGSVTGGTPITTIWTPPFSGNGMLNTWVTPTTTTTYTLTADNLCGSFTDQVTIYVEDLPTIDVDPYYTYCPFGLPVHIDATILNGGIGAPWDPADGLSCTTCVDPYASPNETTTYTLVASSECGTESVEVTVSVECYCEECEQVTEDGYVSYDTEPGVVYCAGNIEIDGNVTFQSNEFKMEPGSTITIPSGSVLTIYGCHFYACEDMWQGFVVEPGGQLVMHGVPGEHDPYPASNLIEDAEAAVYVLDGLASSFPLILDIDYTTFNKNYKSIVIENFQHQLSSYPFRFENNIFTCRDLPYTPNSMTWPETNDVNTAYNVGPLAAPYISNFNYPDNNANAYLKSPHLNEKSFNGIELLNVGTVTDEDSNPTWYKIKIGDTELEKPNLFDNLVYGIYALSSNFTCVNSVFQKTNTVGKNVGAAIYGNSLNENNNLIEVIPGTPDNTHFNSFYDCHNAILTVNYFEHEIRNCVIKSTQTIPATAPILLHRGSRGIYMITNRYRDILIDQNKIDNIQNPISFAGNTGAYDIGGVYTSTSGQYSGNIQIKKNIIKQLGQSPEPLEYISNAIYVTNVLLSTYNHDIVPNTSINIHSNDISFAHRGIHIRNWELRPVYCGQNIISLYQDPHDVNGDPPTQYGINVVYCEEDITVVNNNVTGTYNWNNYNEKGIWFRDSKGLYVSCNFTRRTKNGIEFTGNSYPTTFIKNDMQEHKWGFVLSDGGLIGPQGNSTNPSDNRWLGGWPAGTYMTYMDNAVASLSPLYIQTSPQYFNPDGFSGAWNGDPAYYYSFDNFSLVEVESEPSITLCESKAATTLFTDGYPTLTDDMVEYIVEMANENPAKGYNLYAFLYKHPEIVEQYKLIQEFMQNSASTNVQLMNEIELALLSGKQDKANSQLMNFVPLNKVEFHFKSFVEVLIKYNETGEITEVDNSYVHELAQLCPSDFGAAVYYARSFYNLVNKTSIYFEDNCDGETKAASVASDFKTSDLFTLYPNPGKGQFTIGTNLMAEQLKITISSSSGAIVYTDTIEPIDGKYNFNLDVSKGVYFVNIVDEINSRNEVIRLVVN